MISNSETAKSTYVNEAELEWRCFDALPPELRSCLREALQDYSAEQVLQDYQSRLSASQYDTVSSFFGYGEKPNPIRDVQRNIARLDYDHRQDHYAEMRSQRIRLR